MDKQQKNKLKQTALELEKPGENNVSLTVSEKEQVVINTSNSLDDLLSFDAQIFSSNTAAVARAGSADDEFLKRSESRLANSSKKTVNNAVVTGRKQSLAAMTDNDTEGMPIAIDMSQVVPFDWDNRISKLENEIAEQKKKQETQTRVNKQLEESNHNFKIISIIALLVAVFALIINVWPEVMGRLMPVESDALKQQVMEIDDHKIVPVIERGGLKPDGKQISPQLFETDTNDDVVPPVPVGADMSGISSAIDSMIVTEALIAVEKGSDISVITAAGAMDVKLKGEDSVAVARWGVNLNSYVRRMEVDNKMAELNSKGIPVEMVVVNVGGVRWFRIRVTGFKTKAEAEVYATEIEEIHDSGLAWVSKI